MGRVKISYRLIPVDSLASHTRELQSQSMTGAHDQPGVHVHVTGATSPTQLFSHVSTFPTGRAFLHPEPDILFLTDTIFELRRNSLI